MTDIKKKFQYLRIKVEVNISKSIITFQSIKYLRKYFVILIYSKV